MHMSTVVRGAEDGEAEAMPPASSDKFLALIGELKNEPHAHRLRLSGGGKRQKIKAPPHALPTFAAMAVCD